MNIDNRHFISIEGNEGVGKTTAMQFVKAFFDKEKVDYMLTREPGGTPIAEEIRQVLLNKHEEQMAGDTEVLLMFAARAQHVASKIKPALAQNKWVISDRFVDASHAYQGGGRQIPLDRLVALDNWVLQGFKPGLTLLLDAPVEVCLSRIKERGQLDRIEDESKAFFERIRQVYINRVKMEPQRFVLINTDCDLDDVEVQILQALETYCLSE